MRVTVTPDQILAAFEAVKDDPSFDESRGLWERGQPPVEMIQAMCLRPEILAAFAGFGNCVYPGGLLERRDEHSRVDRAGKGFKSSEQHPAVTHHGRPQHRGARDDLVPKPPARCGECGRTLPRVPD